MELIIGTGYTKIFGELVKPTEKLLLLLSRKPGSENYASAIQEYDKTLQDLLENWRNDLNSIDSKAGESPRRGKKRRADTDLQLAKNPRNPYPIFQLILKSEKFTKKELIAGAELLSETDLKLKSTAQNPKLLLERAIYHICRKAS